MDGWMNDDYNCTEANGIKIREKYKLFELGD